MYSSKFADETTYNIGNLLRDKKFNSHIKRAFYSVTAGDVLQVCMKNRVSKFSCSILTLLAYFLDYL